MLRAGFLGFLPLVVAACSGGGSFDPMVGCMMQVQAPGSYEYDAGTALPVAVPGPDGTQEGADALNACARQRVFGTGALEASVAAELGGQRYETRSSGGITQSTYTYGTPPRTASTQPASRPVAAMAPVGSAASCPMNAPTLYRGTLYCVD